MLDLHNVGEDIKLHTTTIVDRHAQASIDHELNQSVINDLAFDDIYMRDTSIKDPFPTSFRWIFERKDSMERVWNSFVDWLETAQDVYWINGKVGSGKSTLMKFLASEQSTQEHLLKWANGRSLIILRFFFWRNGSSEQRSISGLYRSLLVQIIDHCPEQARLLRGHLINHAPSSSRAGTLKFPKRWDSNILSDALHTVLTSVSTSHRVCLLLDGLDEFQDDLDEQQLLLRAIKRLSNLENVKLVVSHRGFS